MTTAQFKIPEENIGRFKSVIARINVRANKLGFDPITFEIGEGVVTQVLIKSEDMLNEYERILIFPVAVTGVQPVLSGYRFAGKLEHLPGTEETIVFGDVPSKYHQCPPNCDHCHVNRQRTSTFILENVESGEFKQVGKSCLKDFFNGDDPMKHASFMQYLFECGNEFRDMEDYDREGTGGTSYLSPEQILPLAAAVVRTSGYVSAARAESLNCESTGMYIKGMFARNSRVKRPDITDADHAKTLAVLAWLASDDALSKKAESSYMQNLCVMAQTGLVAQKHIGIMVSAVASHDAYEAEKLRMSSMSNSCFVGEVDGKIGPVPIVIKGKKLIPGEAYGDKMLYKMEDDDGNQYTWFSTGEGIGDVGDRMHINASVKAHTEYRGVKQTTLLRVSALENKLYEAVENSKDIKVISKLLNEDIDLDFITLHKGVTALMEAASIGRDDLVELLLSKGANPDVALQGGWTAAMFAASHARSSILSSLQKWGADLGMEGADGETVASILEKERQAIQHKVGQLTVENTDIVASVPVADLIWSRATSVPVEALGKSKKEWADWYELEMASAEESGRTHELLLEKTIVVVQVDGKLDILRGMHQIGATVIDGASAVDVLFGTASTELSLQRLMLPTPSASKKAKVKAGAKVADAPTLGAV